MLSRVVQTIPTWSLLVAVTLIGVGCTKAPVMNPEAPYTPSRAPEVGDILHTPTGFYVNQEAMLTALTDIHVVHVGETHDNPASHRLQLDVLKAMQQRWPGQVALGMEMFTPDQQDVLDAWSSGELSEKEFLRQAGWFTVWRMDFAFYRELLNFARENRIPVIGLNVDKQLRRKVGRTPIEELEEEDRAKLPEMDFSDPYQRSLVEAIYGGHSAGEAMLDGFLRVQTLWDESMAENAANYLLSDTGKDKRMVIVAGGNHIRHGFGIPRRLFRRVPLSYATVGDRAIVISEDKQDRQMDVTLPKFPIPPYDYLVFSEYEDLPDADKKVKLGVQFDESDEGLTLTSVVPGSSAADAGLQQGDILTQIDGEDLKESFDLLYPLSLKRDGDTATFGYLRDGETMEAEVTLKPLRMAK